MFAKQKSLRAKIDKARVETKTLFGETEITFTPELQRVNKVVVKNARCHAVYDLDRWMKEDPRHILAVPLQDLSHEQYEQFEGIETEVTGWPEIGTRKFQRESVAFSSGQGDMSGPWVIVQNGVYRYAVVDKGEDLLVRSVLREYLGTEVYWSSVPVERFGSA